MKLVVDASFLVEAVTSKRTHSAWARRTIKSKLLCAPHFMIVEAANIVRRIEAIGELTPAEAADAYADLLRVPAQLASFSGLAERIWQLRHTVTCYDAWYVALAESLDAPLATLDLRLARASGPHCRFLTPPATVGDAPA